MAFDSLPLEVNEHIASYIDSDTDLCNFTLICPDTHNAVHSHRQSVWRSHFAKRYDLGPGKTGRQLMIAYMTRHMVLKQGARKGFRNARTEGERRTLITLRDLIVESFATTSSTTKRDSFNLRELYRFAKSSNLLDVMLVNVHKSREEARLLQTIQVVLTHLQLDLNIPSPSQDFGLSQQAMYCLPSKMPLFLDKKGTVNMEFMLHNVNFFKQHMTCDGENTLYPLLRDLMKNERPKPWGEAIKNDSVPQAPGLEWRGTYAYIPKLQDLEIIRARDSYALSLDDPIPDAIDYDEGFQTLVLDHVPSMLKWPAAFENHLHAIPPAPVLSELETLGLDGPTCTRRSTRGSHQNGSASSGFSCDSSSTEARSNPRRPPPSPARGRAHSPAKLGKDYIVFTGQGRDLGPYQCSGVIHNLPPQSGIPGWQRLCMMKYTIDPSSGSSTPSSSPTSSFADSSSSAPAYSAASSISSNTSSGAAGSSADPFKWNGENSDSDPVYVDDDCWCYEGIIIPGGKIILGRWWHPLEPVDDMQAIGPFIFWNLD